MKVKFVPQNVECEIKLGQSVMHVAQDHGIYIKSVCKGVPSCAECRVRVVDGDHNVLPPGTEELSLIGTGYFIDRRRLSCQLMCYGDITVDMTEQIAKQQGLIGGQKKKKLAIKDDRIEDQRSIRSSEPDEERNEGEDRPRSPGLSLEEASAQEDEDTDMEADEEFEDGDQLAEGPTSPAPGGGGPNPQGGGRGRRRRRRRGGRGGGGGGGGGGHSGPPRGGPQGGRNGDGRGPRRP